MKRRALIALLVLATVPAAVWPAASQFFVPDTVDYRVAEITSEGVRLHAETFAPRGDVGRRWPTVILCHGWGGVAASLRRQAADFAVGGYVAIVFDYRGWGESDGRLVSSGLETRRRDGQPFSAEVIEVREIIDPFEQTTDIMNVVHWAASHERVDPQRIGLWGTSFAGGHVLHVAVREPRIKAVVAQVGAFDHRGRSEEYRASALADATRRARGELSYPPPSPRVPGRLHGTPIKDHVLLYAPVEDAPRLKAPILYIVAEKEELFRNDDHGRAAWDRTRAKKKYVEIPGITHYDVYRSAREQATKLAIEWYDRYLK